MSLAHDIGGGREAVALLTEGWYDATFGEPCTDLDTSDEETKARHLRKKKARKASARERKMSKPVSGR
jgi:hypothetical protein